MDRHKHALEISEARNLLNGGGTEGAAGFAFARFAFAGAAVAMTEVTTVVKATSLSAY